MLISSRIIFISVSKLLFNQIFGNYSLTNLTHEIRHHTHLTQSSMRVQVITVLFIGLSLAPRIHCALESGRDTKAPVFLERCFRRLKLQGPQHRISHNTKQELCQKKVQKEAWSKSGDYVEPFCVMSQGSDTVCTNKSLMRKDSWRPTGPLYS